MKKMLILVTVCSVVEIVLATTAATKRAAPCPPNVNADSENLLLTATAVTVFEIQADAGPAYILCVENAAQPAGKPATERLTYTSVIGLLPEPATITLLAVSGFLLSRRRNISRRI